MAGTGLVVAAGLLAAGATLFIARDLETLQKTECEMVEFRVGDRTRWSGSTMEGEVCKETLEAWLASEEEPSGSEQPRVRGPGQSDR